MVQRVITWFWWLAVGVVGGPGVAVMGDPGSDPAIAIDGWRRSAQLERSAVIAPTLAVGLAFGAPPAGVAVVAVIGLVVALTAR